MNDTQTLVLVVGPQGSGKTTEAKKIFEEHSDFVYIAGDDFRELLGEREAKFANLDYSIKSPLQKQANWIVKDQVEELFKRSLADGKSVILDSTGLRASTRAWRIEAAKEIVPDIKTVIIGMKTASEVIEMRLAERDTERAGSKWLANYRSFVRDTYELPGMSEADEVVYRGGE